MGYWPSFPKSAAKLQRDTARTCQHLKKNADFLQFFAVYCEKSSTFAYKFIKTNIT